MILSTTPNIEGKRIVKYIGLVIGVAKGMGANAVVGIDYDYETVGANGSMLMINVTGTAVELEE